MDEKWEILPEFWVPLIEVKFPSVSLPEFPPKAPKVDERRAKIIRHSIADDFGSLVPVVGDVISDTSYKELRELMSSDEYERFSEDNKLMPSVLATLKVFTEEK